MTMPTDVAAAVERLEQYNLGQYDEVTNPFGLSGIGGMDANWERHNADMALVANWLAGAVDGVDDGAAAAAQSVIDAAGEVALAVLAKGQAEAARDAAQEARDLAGQYRDEALGAVGGVLVSGGDTTPAPLGTKLTVSPGLTKSTTSPGGNEALNLAVDFASDAEAATGTATAKAVTPAALKGWVPALTEITGGNVDPAADFIPIYDASGAVVRKVKPNNLGITSGMTNPMTTAGDMIVGGSGGTPTRFGKGDPYEILSLDDGGNYVWANITELSIPSNVWLHFTAQAGVDTGSTNVWTDQIGGVIAKQATSGNRPTFTTFLGVPCLDFDGTNDVLQTDDIPALALNGVSTVTFMALVSCDSNSDEGFLQWPEVGSFSKSGLRAWQTGVGGQLGIGNTSSSLSATMSSKSTNWFVVCYEFNSGATTLGMNKATLTTGTASPTFSSGTDDKILIGGFDGGRFNGRIAEIYIWQSAIGTAGRNAAVDAFVARYGLTFT